MRNGKKIMDEVKIKCNFIDITMTVSSFIGK